MDARLMRLAILASAIASLGASYRTQNFIVNAPTPQMAEQIGRAAEKYRRDLAVEWIGKEMPNWFQACPITAEVADHLGAGGETSFVFDKGEVFGWRMRIQGSLVRVLDSVLPHEVMHTVFATHFRQPLPRWADEGACTTVEHDSERAKQQVMLIKFLQTEHGIAFNRMFAMKDYPRDVLPLYSQGYSVARYLIAQGGKRKFLDFIGDGLKDENWSRAVSKHYGVASLAALQNNWLDWVRKGSPQIDTPRNTTQVAAAAPAPADATNASRPSGKHAPVGNTFAAAPRPGAAPRELSDPSRAAAQVDQNTLALNSSSGGEQAATSIYQLAATRKDLFDAPLPAPQAAAQWHAAPAGEPAGDMRLQPAAPAASMKDSAGRPLASPPEPDRSLPSLIPYQATRPQSIDRPQQVIVEWSRSQP